MTFNFTDQNIIPAVAGELCLFTNKDIDSLLKSDLLPKSAAIKPYSPTDKADLVSEEWVCFMHFPFSLGMKYPFPPLVNQFFKTTGISYSQTMPMVWRILNSLVILSETHNLDIGLPEIAACYQLRTHGYSRFILKTRDSHRQMVPRLVHSDNGWKRKFFFVKRSSIPNGESLPKKWVREAPRFEDLVLPSPIDSPRLNRLFSIKNRERASLSTNTASQASTSDHTPTMSSAPTPASHKFSFSDIQSSFIKKEKTTETPSKKPARAPVTRNKKRSLEPAIQVDSDEEITFDDAKNRALLGINQMIQLSMKNVDALKAKADLEAELAAANGKINDLVKIAAQREAHSKILERQWTKKYETDLAEVKECARIAVLESMYHMAEAAAVDGYCHGDWELEGWAAMLNKPSIKVAVRECVVEAGEETADAGEAAADGAAEDKLGDDGGSNAGAQ